VIDFSDDKLENAEKIVDYLATSFFEKGSDNYLVARYWAT